MSPAKLLPGPYPNKCAGGLQTEMEGHRITEGHETVLPAVGH